jgi:integrase
MVVWVADSDNPGKRKQHVATFDTLTEAWAERGDYTAKKPKKAPRHSKVTLRELWEEVQATDDYRDRAASTKSRDESAWEHVKVARLDGRYITDIEPEDITKALEPLKSTPEMQAKTRLFLSMLFQFELDKGKKSRIDTTPVRSPRRATTRAARKRTGAQKGRLPRILTSEELRRLVGEIPERWRAMVELMAYSGLRPGEAVTLTLGKFNPLKRSLVVNEALYEDTKTGEPRTLKPLPQEVVDFLREHITRVYGDGPWDPDAPMFPKADGTAIATKNSYDSWSRRVFGRATERSGINHRLSPNDLRHYAASYSIGLGADVYAVKNMLGHAKASTTLDIYGELWSDAAKKLAKRQDTHIRRERSKRVTDATVVDLA